MCVWRDDAVPGLLVWWLINLCTKWRIQTRTQKIKMGPEWTYRTYRANWDGMYLLSNAIWGARRQPHKMYARKSGLWVVQLLPIAFGIRNAMHVLCFWLDWWWCLLLLLTCSGNLGIRLYSTGFLHQPHVWYYKYICISMSLRALWELFVYSSNSQRGMTIKSDFVLVLRSECE